MPFPYHPWDWYIYLHWAYCYGKCRYIYHTFWPNYNISPSPRFPFNSRGPISLPNRYLLGWKSKLVFDHLEPQTTIYKWLFQLEDSKSLHRKWLFRQTSIYKWLFGVPGSNTRIVWNYSPMLPGFRRFRFRGSIAPKVGRIHRSKGTHKVFSHYVPHP